MQNTPGHDEACSTPCYLVCRIKTKLGDKTSRTYICIKENNIGHMMNNASHLRLPLFLWNFVVSPSGSGVTLWSAMIETNRLVLLNREAPVVPTDSARTDRIRNALTAWFCAVFTVDGMVATQSDRARGPATQRRCATSGSLVAESGCLSDKVWLVALNFCNGTNTNFSHFQKQYHTFISNPTTPESNVTTVDSNFTKHMVKYHAQ